jgi:hypothetical protein
VDATGVLGFDFNVENKLTRAFELSAVAGDTTRVGSREAALLPFEDRLMYILAFIAFDCPDFIMASANDCTFPEDFRAAGFVAGPPALGGSYRDCMRKLVKPQMWRYTYRRLCSKW